jgi:hypothetical protein
VDLPPRARRRARVRFVSRAEEALEAVLAPAQAGPEPQPGSQPEPASGETAGSEP